VFFAFLRKIIKIVVVRCQLLRVKCFKFDFGWGSTPDPVICIVAKWLDGLRCHLVWM